MRGTAGTARELAALILLGAAGALSLGLAPLIVSALSAGPGLSIPQAGSCVSSEQLGAGLGTVLVLFLLGKVRLRRLGTMALLFIIAGNLLSLVFSSFFALWAARLLAGIGCGLTAAAYGSLATTAAPERNFAIYNGAVIITVSACGMSVPHLVAFGGDRSLFALIAGFSLVALLCIGWSADRPISMSPATTPTGFALLQSRPALLGSLIILFYFIAIAVLWTYVADIGASHRYGASAIATTISLSFLVGGLVASFVATILARNPAKRAMRRRIVTICTIGGAITTASVIVVPLFPLFAAAVLIFVFLWILLYPFLMGLLSELDPTGWLAVLSLALQSAGFVIGPLVGGALIDGDSSGTSIAAGRYIALGVACAISFLLALVCALAAQKSLPRLSMPEGA
jgi:predicted MFS family arabinose efflux permease